MWFDCEAVPLSFTERSPYRIENEAIIDASPERVFEILADGSRQIEWFEDFVACRWTSKPPHGLGSEREIELKALTVKERFLAWDPGKRMTFHIYAITVPLVSAMVEDLKLAPAGEGKTRFTWTVHYRPTLLMRAIHPIGRAVFGKMFKKTTERLQRFAKDHPKA